MTDKIKNQSMGTGNGGSLDDDTLSRKEIAEIGEKADPRDVSLFTEKLTKDGHNRGENDSDSPLNFGDNNSKTFLESKETKLTGNEHGQRESDSGNPRLDSQRHGFDDIGHNGPRTFPEPKEAKPMDFPKSDQNNFVASKIMDNTQAGNILPANEYAKSQKRDSSRKDTDTTEVKDTSAMSGTKILDNMQLRHIDPKVNESAQVIKNLAIQVAERIIATNEALNAKQEVRITLQDGILKNTEVSISKEGKTLNVAFSTGSNDSENLLRANSDALARQLQNNLKDTDRIEIEIEQHGQSASDNQNNDGRSRDRFGNQQQGEDEEDQDR
jgi:hypothetical protein